MVFFYLLPTLFDRQNEVGPGDRSCSRQRNCFFLISSIPRMFSKVQRKAVVIRVCALVTISVLDFCLLGLSRPLFRFDPRKSKAGVQPLEIATSTPKSTETAPRDCVFPTLVSTEQKNTVYMPIFIRYLYKLSSLLCRFQPKDL